MPTPSIDLSNKNILVTGGAGFGVGGGICEAIAAFGGNLFINDIREDALQEAVEKYPGSVAVPGDISQASEVERMFREINEQYGVVHNLVNSAGIGITKPMYEVEEHEYDRLFGVNVRAMWLMSKAFVRQLLPTKTEGAIVNVSSVHAKAASAQYVVYAGTKGAVEGLTRAMAVELGRFNIRCNAIGPGYVHAEQNYDLLKNLADDPHQWVDTYKNEYQSIPRLIEARDCGNVAAFLLSDLSRAVTGQVMYVDQGLTSMLFTRGFSEKE
uniref:SDR family NAD(P)-dependent oxidoreductase n=1 Tax=Roseihalotalea indica TaxID=2867963 RepID=A0AA49GQC4_9BACT|nr:SDR family NAD(P)-dependent oxidoreductase [Tunicatimonas sp. TK19036]